VLTRRQLFKAGASGAAVAASPALLGGTAAQAQSGTTAPIDPTTIPKYATPLFVMPAARPVRVGPDLDEYRIAVRQLTQQMLPDGYPRTTGFGFGSVFDHHSFGIPGPTIEARADRWTRVTWANQLMTPFGTYLPHLLPVDPTLHWANPPGGAAGRDTKPSFTSTPGPYRGPVPLVVHLHGQHAWEDSDGYPEAWYLPPAWNIPPGYARVGSVYDQFRQEARDRYGVHWSPGNAVFQYPNDQRATALWYHSHSLGMTRTNIYAGQAGMYLIRGGASDLPPGVLPGPAPGWFDPPGTRYHELPLVIQDKRFNSDGSLSFPASREEFFDGYGGPYIPETDVNPIWNPVFFGDTIVVNGRTWPYLEVEPRRYRFRVLDASNTRGYTLKVVADPLAARPAPAALPIWVIGADGGFLPAPAAVESVDIGVAERLDLVVDFTGLPAGTELYLSNEGGLSDPATTGQILKFVVTPLRSLDRSVPPDQLSLPSRTPLSPATVTRQLTMNAEFSAFAEGVQIADLLGTLNPDGTSNPLRWSDPLTETPALGSTEIWELYNFSPVGHLIHVHLVQFEVLDRRPIEGGTPQPPLSWETGTKDTLVSPPGQITRIKSTFDKEGRFVWHCHLVDHEDNEMMRPYVVS
jgi:spore coat protein A